MERILFREFRAGNLHIVVGTARKFPVEHTAVSPLHGNLFSRRVLALKLPFKERLCGLCRNLLRPRLHARGNQDAAVHAAAAVPVERGILSRVGAVDIACAAAENQIAVRVQAVAARRHIEFSARNANPNLGICLLLLSLRLLLVIVFPRVHAVIVRADVKAAAAHLYGLALNALARMRKHIGTAGQDHRAVGAYALTLIALCARPDRAALQGDTLFAAENIVLRPEVKNPIRDNELTLCDNPAVCRFDIRAAAAPQREISLGKNRRVHAFGVRRRAVLLFSSVRLYAVFLFARKNQREVAALYGANRAVAPRVEFHVFEIQRDRDIRRAHFDRQATLSRQPVGPALVNHEHAFLDLCAAPLNLCAVTPQQNIDRARSGVCGRCRLLCPGRCDSLTTAAAGKRCDKNSQTKQHFDMRSSVTLSHFTPHFEKL